MNITNNISQRLKNIGPGSVIAAAFIGPGTVTMCSLAGAKFGYSLIWALIISVLLTLFIQLTAVRIGISTKKSLSNLSAQIIDDIQKKTLVSASSIEKEVKSKKVKKIEKSTLIGEILAKRAKEKNISKVYFDRGGYKYHGRVKVFAETLRKNGLKF